MISREIGVNNWEISFATPERNENLSAHVSRISMVFKHCNVQIEARMWKCMDIQFCDSFVGAHTGCN